MTIDLFNNLTHKEKLTFAHYKAQEVDGFVPWTYPYRYVKIYAFDTFFIELVYNLEIRTLERVFGFSDFNYLEQYHEYTYLMERKVGWLLPPENEEGLSDSFDWVPPES